MSHEMGLNELTIATFSIQNTIRKSTEKMPLADSDGAICAIRISIREYLKNCQQSSRLKRDTSWLFDK
jgi:hypothetical protein